MNQTNSLTRRHFLAAASAAGALMSSADAAPAGATPALLGGKPVRSKGFSPWPLYGQEEEKTLLEALRSGHWYRGSGKMVSRFEAEYARLTGAKYCLALSSGTGALLTCLGALDAGPGDEVILPPYTFVATLNVILMRHALPVFVDSDLNTGQIDATKIEKAITSRTLAMIPVHMSGAPANLDAILPIGQKHKVPVIEDAAQAHLAEWRGRKVGSLGDTGCFSFQATKNLNCGEGGAIITSNEELYEKCFAFHWNGQGHKTANFDLTDSMTGIKLLMTEFQGAILLAQMSRLEEQAKARDDNAHYLDKILADIPGIVPMKMYPGATRRANHLYMFRYEQERFQGLPIEKFVKAMDAEGIPCTMGYAPLNARKYLKNTLASRAYKRIYSAKELADLEARNHCPVNDRLCREMLWLYQGELLGNHSDMDQISEAMRKIHDSAGALAKA